MNYRVCKDGVTISKHEKLSEAKKALKQLKLKSFENGYIDDITEGEDKAVPLYQKLTTSGKLLECT